jgi:hypothetical protein
MPRALTPGDFSGCGLIYTSELSAHIGGSRTVGSLVCHWERSLRPFLALPLPLSLSL